MFERFTDRARRVLVLAQEEARLLNHNFIGTEHILLGLVHEGDGIAAQALGQLDVGLVAVREKVEETIGPAGTSVSGSPPFTPRAKKVLELALREALQLGHNYIGTEHILLGLVREGEGVAAQVLVGMGADLPRVRQAVMALLDGRPGLRAPEEGRVAPGDAARLRCSRCGADLIETARYRALEVPSDEAGPAQPSVHAVLLYCSFCGALLWPAVDLRVPLAGPVVAAVAGYGEGGPVPAGGRRSPDSDEPAPSNDEAALAQAAEAGQAARAEMGSGKPLSVARKRQLRRVVREGDEAAETLRRRQPPGGERE
jgi:hypothetical protein